MLMENTRGSPQERFHWVLRSTSNYIKIIHITDCKLDLAQGFQQIDSICMHSRYLNCTALCPVFTHSQTGIRAIQMLPEVTSAMHKTIIIWCCNKTYNKPNANLLSLCNNNDDLTPLLALWAPGFGPVSWCLHSCRGEVVMGGGVVPNNNVCAIEIGKVLNRLCYSQ